MLTAEPAVLHAAERHFVVSDMQRIDPDVACFDSLRSASSLREILCPDRGAEAILGTVRFSDALLEIFYLEDRQHRTKRLFLHDASVLGNFGQHGRQIKE